jgi:hypothetical protein
LLLLRVGELLLLPAFDLTAIELSAILPTSLTFSYPGDHLEKQLSDGGRSFGEEIAACGKFGFERVYA